MNTDTRLARNPGVLFRELGGETVVYNPDNQQSVALDPIGTLVWTCLAEPVSIAELVPDFAAAFDAEPATIERDLLDLAETLNEHEFIVVAP